MKPTTYTILGLLGFYVVVMVTSAVGIMNDYLLRVINLMMINIILGVSLNLINGYTGLFSVGHAGFMIVGGYVAGFMTTLLFGITKDTPYWEALPLFLVAILAAALVSALVGFLIGLPVLRLTDDYLAIVTIGFGEIIPGDFNFITFKKKVGNWELDIGGPRGLLGIPPLSNFTVIFLFTLFTVLFIRNFVFSRHGRACIAIRENEVAAHMMGIPITRYKVLAFVLGSTFAGIGGALLAHFIRAPPSHDGRVHEVRGVPHHRVPGRDGESFRYYCGRHSLDRPFRVTETYWRVADGVVWSPVGGSYAETTGRVDGTERIPLPAPRTREKDLCCSKSLI